MPVLHTPCTGSRGVGGGGGGGDELKVILNNILIKKFVWKRRNGMQHDGLSRIGLSIMSPLQARHKRGRCLLSICIYISGMNRRERAETESHRGFLPVSSRGKEGAHRTEIPERTGAASRDRLVTCCLYSIPLSSLEVRGRATPLFDFRLVSRKIRRAQKKKSSILFVMVRSHGVAGGSEAVSLARKRSMESSVSLPTPCP